MPKIVIDKEKCKGCLLCIEFCPRKVIKKSNKMNRYGIKPVEFIDNQTCLGCGHCVLVCAESCIEVSK
jgi:2-oxoglutarate ferredoxin oxidoreductase subunit delta